MNDKHDNTKQHALVFLIHSLQGVLEACPPEIDSFLYHKKEENLFSMERVKQRKTWPIHSIRWRVSGAHFSVCAKVALMSSRQPRRQTHMTVEQSVREVRGLRLLHSAAL